MKVGYLFLDDSTYDSDEYVEEIIPSPQTTENSPEDSSLEGGEGYDIFGQKISDMYFGNISCPNCYRKLAVKLFAGHLEKCMGRNGQKSSHRACKRAIDDEALNSDDTLDEVDDGEDSDWDSYAKKRSMKKKKGKKDKRPRTPRIEDIIDVPSCSQQPITYEEIEVEPTYGPENSDNSDDRVILKDSSTQDDLTEYSFVQEKTSLELDFEAMRNKFINSQRPIRSCHDTRVMISPDEIISIKSKSTNMGTVVQEISIEPIPHTSPQWSPEHTIDIQMIQDIKDHFYTDSPLRPDYTNIDVDTVDENFHMWKLNFSRSPSPESSNADGQEESSPSSSS